MKKSPKITYPVNYDPEPEIIYKTAPHRFTLGFLIAVVIMSGLMFYGVGSKMVIISFNGFKPSTSISEQPIRQAMYQAEASNEVNLIDALHYKHKH
jgi:hypothetical protein